MTPLLGVVFSPDYVTEIVWGLAGILLMMLFAPVGYFFWFGWPARRNDVLNAISEGAAKRYFAFFHSAEQKTIKGKDERDRFLRYFGQQFGRRRFVIPALLLLLLASALLYLCALSALAWLGARSTEGVGVLPLAMVLAVLGGYTWVVSDLLERAWREEMSALPLFWGAFRLAIAVPVGFAFGKVFDSAWSLPMAFLFGTLPTTTLMTVGRRVALRWAQMPDAPAGGQTQLEVLFSVETYTSERLAAEGVTSITQMAYCDPVRLSIRTGMSFSEVVSVASEAMLALYLTSRPRLDAARKYGLCGSYECVTLWEGLSSADLTLKARAEANVMSLAGDLGVSRDALLNVLDEIQSDPYTQFLRACWASNMPPAGAPAPP